MLVYLIIKDRMWLIIFIYEYNYFDRIEIENNYYKFG